MYDHDIDQAKEIHAKVLKHLEANDLPCSPRFYEVLYVFFGSLNTDLREELSGAVKGGFLDAEILTDAYERYLSDGRHEELVEKAGNEIQNTLSDVTGLVGNMRGATTEYSGTLKDVSEKISQVDNTDDIKALMESVAEDTTKMLAHNQELELQLDQSTQAMETLKKDLERVKREAMTDALTAISNRKAFDETLDRMLSKAENEGETFCLLLLDIDHFKAFNDNHGHQVGDQVLRLVAKTLTDGIKGRDKAARYGGEEFAIILPESNQKTGMIVGENLRKALAQKEIINRATGEALGRITMSVGVAEYKKGEVADSLIARADTALYNAKNNGRNQVSAAL